MNGFYNSKSIIFCALYKTCSRNIAFYNWIKCTVVKTVYFHIYNSKTLLCLGPLLHFTIVNTKVLQYFFMWESAL